MMYSDEDKKPHSKESLEIEKVFWNGFGEQLSFDNNVLANFNTCIWIKVNYTGTSGKNNKTYSAQRYGASKPSGCGQ